MVEASSDNNWLALESNPEVVNNYISEIGFDTTKYLFYDILGTEEWAQDMIPKPVLAVMLLYPIKEASEEWNKTEEEKILKDGQKVSEKVKIIVSFPKNNPQKIYRPISCTNMPTTPAEQWGFCIP